MSGGGAASDGGSYCSGEIHQNPSSGVSLL
jgi:hypothetical protein